MPMLELTVAHIKVIHETMRDTGGAARLCCMTCCSFTLVSACILMELLQHAVLAKRAFVACSYNSHQVQGK